MMFQIGCTLFAHIQIITNQETTITDQLLTNGAVVHMLRSIPNCYAASLSEFLLIQCIVNDLLALCGGWESGLGKTDRLITVFRTAASASYPEPEDIFR